jgi:hypothetical protein
VREYLDDGLRIQCRGSRAAKTWVFAQSVCRIGIKGQYGGEISSLGRGLKQIGHFPYFIAVVGVFRFDGE